MTYCMLSQHVHNRMNDKEKNNMRKYICEEWQWDERDDNTNTNIHEVQQNINCLMLTDTLELEYFGNVTELFKLPESLRMWHLRVSLLNPALLSSDSAALCLTLLNICLKHVFPAVVSGKQFLRNSHSLYLHFFKGIVLFCFFFVSDDAHHFHMRLKLAEHEQRIHKKWCMKFSNSFFLSFILLITCWFLATAISELF